MDLLAAHAVRQLVCPRLSVGLETAPDQKYIVYDALYKAAGCPRLVRAEFFNRLGQYHQALSALPNRPGAVRRWLRSSPAARSSIFGLTLAHEVIHECATKICVVGSCMIDLISQVPRLPKLGETMFGHTFHMGYGGKGANQAVMAAKLGAQVSMVTKLGRDVFGDGTLKNLQDQGINTQWVLFDDQLFSGVAPILWTITHKISLSSFPVRTVHYPRRMCERPRIAFSPPTY